jgi:sugar phosphate isomerase/epimerase
MHRPIISLQLYTVRDHMAKDPLGTLEKIRSLGYEGVEGSGYGNSPEFLAKLKEVGLLFTGGHVDLNILTTKLDEVIEENKRIGNRFVILPYVDESHRGSEEKWVNLAHKLNGIGEKLGAEGIGFCYHHHDFEISEHYGRRCALDIILQNSDPQNVQAEIDTYWVEKGGKDPSAFIEKYAGRVPIVHIKDIDRKGNFAEVGEGELDWATIFNVSEKQGVKIYAVEQDICEGDSMEAIATSISNLRKMRKI